MRSKVIVAVVAIALAAAAAWWWFGQPGDGGPLVLTGNVEVRQVNLAFKVGGRIKLLKVDEGDTIADAQSLASLDKAYFTDTIAQIEAQRDQAKAELAKLEAGNRPEEIAQAEAAVNEREATLTNAKLALDRAQKLLGREVGTQRAYDDAQAAYREADARLNSAKQALRLMRAGARTEDIAAARARLAQQEAALLAARRALADSDLVAPSRGVISSRVHEVGAIVGPGETVFVVSLTNPVWVRSYVSEVDLGRIKPGMKVVVRTDTPGTPSLEGQIGFISTTAEFTPKTVETRALRTALVYRIRVIVKDPTNVLRQGMPVTLAVADAAPVKVSSKSP